MKYTVYFDPKLTEEQVISIVKRPLYRGVSKLRQHAYARKDYKGKNENGGIKCTMTTPASYKNRPHPCCITWGTLYEGTINYIPAPNKV